MAFNPKDLGAYKDFIDSQAKISKVMSKSSKDFASGIKDALVAKRDLVKLQKQANKLEQEELALRKEMENLSGEELKNAEARLAAIREERKETDKLLQQQKALSAALSSQVGSVKNLTVAIGRDLIKGVGKVLSKAKELGKEFSEMDDSMRRTAVNIGMVGKQFNQLRKTAYKAALVTDRIGVGAKELVETYGSYVDEVGRLIPLTNNAAKSLAFMAKGTALGAQGAAQMAASMEVFGMSIESTAAYVEDVSNMSEKMGVNSGKTLKLLSQNLKKAQTVRFKGGVDGMAKMAAKAIAIRADMAGTLSLAQDLWNPEKAIDTAAQLQMMGGAFARMADPIKLMFDARNNPGKIMEDLASAAGSVVRRSKEGIYEIPTMELQRLQQVAQATGLDFEQIVESAKTMAKRNDIGKALDPRIKGDAREYIKGIAEMKDGKLQVTVDGKAVKVSQLTQKQVESMMSQDKSLQKRAEQSQGFMTRLDNLLKSLKNLASSFFAGMDTTLGPLLDSLTGRGEGSLSNLSDQMYRLGENFGEWIATTAKPFIERAIPMIGALTGKLTEGVGNAANFFKNQVIPATQRALAWLKSFWEENGPFIKKVLQIMGEVSKLVWGVLGKIYDVFGAKGILATIILVKFPGLLRGAFSMLTGGLKGIASLFSSSKSVPQLVTVTNMGAMGGPGGGSPLDMMGGRGTFGKRLFGRLGSRQGRSVLMRAARMGKGGLGTRIIGGGMNMLAGAGRFMGKGATRMLGPSLTKGIANVGGKAIGGGAKILGRVGTGLAKGGPLALLGVGAEVGRMFMDDPDSTMGKTLGVLGTTASDAAMGMMIGSMLGPLGTAVGGIIGGIVGFGRSMYREITTKGKKDFDMSGAKSDMGNIKLATAGSSYMGDGAVMPNGNAILTAKGQFFRTAPQDIITAAQPGRAGGGGYGGGNISVNGTINLQGAGVTKNMMEDAQFRREVTKMVTMGQKTDNR